MEKITLLVDMDSVLNYHRVSLLEEFAKRNILEKRFEGLNNLSYRTKFTGIVFENHEDLVCNNFSFEKRVDCLLEVYSDFDFWMNLKPVIEMQETLTLIKRFYNPIMKVVTVLPYGKTDEKVMQKIQTISKEAKILWLDKYFNDIFDERIFLNSPQKKDVEGDILIDDSENSLCFNQLANKIWVQPTWDGALGKEKYLPDIRVNKPFDLLEFENQWIFYTPKSYFFLEGFKPTRVPQEKYFERLKLLEINKTIEKEKVEIKEKVKQKQVCSQFLYDSFIKTYQYCRRKYSKLPSLKSLHFEISGFSYPVWLDDKNIYFITLVEEEENPEESIVDLNKEFFISEEFFALLNSIYLQGYKHIPAVFISGSYYYNYKGTIMFSNIKVYKGKKLGDFQELAGLTFKMKSVMNNFSKNPSYEVLQSKVIDFKPTTIRKQEDLESQGYYRS
jgi:hypothetical protein